MSNYVSFVFHNVRYWDVYKRQVYNSLEYKIWTIISLFPEILMFPIIYKYFWKTVNFFWVEFVLFLCFKSYYSIVLNWFTLSESNAWYLIYLCLSYMTLIYFNIVQKITQAYILLSRKFYFIFNLKHICYSLLNRQWRKINLEIRLTP